MPVDLKQICAARHRIRDDIYLSPAPLSRTLSELTGARVHVKLENLQMTGAFKERGALNAMLLMSETERARGVLAASAGNHAQGVAYHAARLGIAATIVMPSETPLIKVTSVRQMGARVVLHGGDFDEAYQRSREVEKEEGLTYLHPFENPAVICGQGTIALEILEQIPDVDAVIVPVGGGGLIGGMSVALKALKPSVRVIGVEAETAAGMGASREAGRVVELATARTLADGIAVKRVGECTLELARRYVDDLAAVSEDEIANAILLLLEIEKTVAEGAGAAGLAALLNRDLGLAGRRVCLVVSGGNIDVNVLARIIERGLVKDGRLASLMVRVPDRPGALSTLTAAVAREGANILEVAHQRAFSRAAFGLAEVRLVLETRGPEHVEQITQALVEDGYEPTPH